MNILKKINLGSFSKYKLWILVLIFAFIQTTLSQDMDNKIKTKKIYLFIIILKSLLSRFIVANPLIEQNGKILSRDKNSTSNN